MSNLLPDSLKKDLKVYTFARNLCDLFVDYRQLLFNDVVSNSRSDAYTARRSYDEYSDWIVSNSSLSFFEVLDSLFF